MTKRAAPMTPAAPEAEDFLAEAAGRLRTYKREQTRALIEVGEILIRVKAALPHGAFGPWLEREMQWTVRTAQNYMRAAETLGHKCETVSHLPPRTVYRLAAPKLDDETRAEIVDLIADPADPPLSEIEGRLRAAEATAAEERRLEALRRRRGRLTEKQKRQEERRLAQEESNRVKRREEIEAANRRAADAAKIILANLTAKDLADLRAALHDGGFDFASALAAALREGDG